FTRTRPEPEREPAEEDAEADPSGGIVRLGDGLGEPLVVDAQLDRAADRIGGGAQDVDRDHRPRRLLDHELAGGRRTHDGGGDDGRLLLPIGRLLLAYQSENERAHGEGQQRAREAGGDREARYGERAGHRYAGPARVGAGFAAEQREPGDEQDVRDQ